MSEENESRPPFKRPFRHFTAPVTDNKEFVFGVQSVLETLRSGKEIDRLLVQRELGNTEILDLAKEKGIQVIPVGNFESKDEFFNVKAVSAQDVFNAHRFPAGLGACATA